MLQRCKYLLWTSWFMWIQLVFIGPLIHVLDYSCVWVAPWQKYNGGMGLLCNSRHIRYRTTLCSVNCIVELTSKCRSFLILGRLKLNLVKYNRNWFTTPHVLVVQIKCTCTNMTLFLVCFGWITKEIRYKGNCLPNDFRFFCWMYLSIL